LMKPDALIFDLDGTLWDAAAASAAGWTQALEEMGVPRRVDIAGIRSVSGTPFSQCVETLLPEFNPVSKSTLRLLDAGERAGIEALGGVLYTGVADGLHRLAAVFRLFLVSNCPDWYLAVFLRRDDLRECFTAWDCHGSSGMSKPAMLQRLSKRFRLGHAVYVGDTQGDRDAARDAGMEFALVRYGFGCANAPDLAFDDFDDLVSHYVDRLV
jgi:phosphoglycolate phosphatase